MRCPEEHTPLGTCCWPGSQLRSAHSPSPAGHSTVPRGRQWGTATALQCLREWEGAQKPNFPIIRPKVSNSGPSFGYQHPCSLHRRQSPGMPMGFGVGTSCGPGVQAWHGVRGAGFLGDIWGPLGGNKGSSRRAPAPWSQSRSARPSQRRFSSPAGHRLLSNFQIRV